VLLKSPDGKVIVDHNYWALSSITFYVPRDVLILNGRYFNLEYGSYAPGAPDIFIDDTRFKSLWLDSPRYYLVTYQPKLHQFKDLLGQDHLEIVAAGGGKLILTNHPFEHARLPRGDTRFASSFQEPACKDLGIQVKKESPDHSGLLLGTPACRLRI